MINKSSPFVLLISLSCMGSVGAEDSEAVEKFQEMLTLSFVQEIHDDIASELLESGLSESDAERIINNFGSDMAKCVFEALNQSLERRSLNISDIPPDMIPNEIGALFPDEAEFEELTETCFYTALERAGIQYD